MSRIPLVAQSVVLVALVGLVLFGSAGRLDVTAFWAYLAFWLGASLVSVAVVDPTLYQERMRPGGRRIKAAYWLLMVPLILHLVVAGVDVGRKHWSDAVPHALQWLGMLVFAAGWGLTLWAMHVNRFFSAARMPKFLPYTATAAATNTVPGTRSNCPAEKSTVKATTPQRPVPANKPRMLSDVKRPVTPVAQAMIQRARITSTRNSRRYRP